MSAINRLGTVDTLSASDQVAIFSTGLGNDAAATLATLQAYLQQQLTADSAPITQYAAPGASGFSVTIAPPEAGTSVFLLLQPGGAYAAGTLVLPAGVDGQEVLVREQRSGQGSEVEALAAGERVRVTWADEEALPLEGGGTHD